jgi:acetyl-CoA C-acetyltransferase
MKSIMLAAQNIQTGQRDIMAAGGMESMSNAPCVWTTGHCPIMLTDADGLFTWRVIHRFYLSRTPGYGHQQMTDSIVKDGVSSLV